MPRRKEPRIPDAVLDQLLAGADPRAALEPNGLLDDLKKALAERVLNAEMDHHLAGEDLKLKTLLRKADPRTTEDTWRQIGSLLDHFTAQECANYLANAGYAST